MHKTFHHKGSPAKLLLVGVALTLSAAFVTLRPSASHAQTQGAMNVQASQDFKVADAKLNIAYKRLFDHLDKTSQAKLRATQRAWIVFRDDEADFHADATARGGSMEPLDYSETRADITRTRTHELEAMLKDFSSR